MKGSGGRERPHKQSKRRCALDSAGACVPGNILFENKIKTREITNRHQSGNFQEIDKLITTERGRADSLQKNHSSHAQPRKSK